MYNFSNIEDSYQKFIKEIESFIPEGIYEVNLALLHHFDLLKFQPSGEDRNPLVNRYFHLLESPEKITLVNDEFIVWIVPGSREHVPITHTMIALNKGEQEPQLEASFIASGIYNNPKLVLKILEKFLMEIHETEIALSKFKVAG